MVAFVAASRYRLAAAKALASGPLTPTKIADLADVRTSHISRALGELVRIGAVKALSSRGKLRIYALTPAGEGIAAKAAKLQRGNNDGS